MWLLRPVFKLVKLDCGWEKQRVHVCSTAAFGGLVLIKGVDESLTHASYKEKEY